MGRRPWRAKNTGGEEGATDRGRSIGVDDEKSGSKEEEIFGGGRHELWVIGDTFLPAEKAPAL